MEKLSHKTDIPPGQKRTHTTIAATTTTTATTAAIIHPMNLFSMWCSMEVPFFAISKGSDK